MPYGAGPFIREALVRATPWQRVVIAMAMIASGAVLVVLGHLAGGLLSAGGVLLLLRMVRVRIGRRRKTSGATSEGGREAARGRP
jgi:ABC-type protease/lipase transport system fused ATPase/permease subunit